MQKIEYGFLFKQAVYDGNRCKNTTLNFSKSSISGFLYGDAIIGATIVLIILPVILQIFFLSTQNLEMSYHRDQIEQDVVAFIEEGKSAYDSGNMPKVGVAKSHFSPSTTSTEYILTEEPIEVNGIFISRYTVQAVEFGKTIYEVSTYLGAPLE